MRRGVHVPKFLAALLTGMEVITMVSVALLLPHGSLGATLLPTPAGKGGTGGSPGLPDPLSSPGPPLSTGPAAPGMSPPASPPGGPAGSSPSVSGRSDNAVVATIPVGDSPASSCFDPISGNIYIGDRASNSVSVIHGGPRTLQPSVVGVGDGPDALACNGPDGEVFVANSGSNNVSVINGINATGVGSFAAGLSPDGIAYDPFIGEVYVADSGSGSILAISASTGQVTATIPVGSLPAGIGYDPLTGDLYVADTGTGTVVVVSGATHAVLRSITVGSRPEGVVYDPINRNLFVTNTGSGTVSVISDRSNMVVDTIPVGNSPGGIGFDQDNGRVYVANANSNFVSVLSGGMQAGALGSIPVGSGTRDVAADVGSGELYVVEGDLNQVVVVSPASSSVVIATIPLPEVYPEDIGYDRENGEVYVADEAGNTVDVIASTGPATNTIIAIIPVGSNPAAVSVGNPAGTLNGIIYVANAGSDSVSVISGSTNAVIATVPVGNGPRGLAYDSENSDVYVNNEGAGTASVISSQTNTVIATIPSVNGAGQHTSATYDSSNGDIYMSSSGSVIVIHGTTNTIIATIPTGGYIYTLGYDSGSGNIYVTSAGSTVWVISGATNTIVATISGPFASSEGIAYDEANGLLYMGDEDGGNTMWVINGTTNSVVTYLNVGTLADGTVYDSVNGDNYVANEQTKTASVIATVFLTSVAVNPPSATVPTGGMKFLDAVPTCTGGPCPIGITYSWSVTPGNLGSLTSVNSVSTKFLAGSVPGSVNVTVTATLNNAPVYSAAVPLTIVPGLTSMSATPSSAVLFPGGSQNFTTTLTCTGGPCPSGAVYAWVLNNTLANLSSTNLPGTTLTAGPTAGLLYLAVSATLNGYTASRQMNVSIIPALTVVTVSPSFQILPTGSTQTFTAVLTCTGGSCPQVGSYLWSLNNSLGMLNISRGPQVSFTAGNQVGTVDLVVNVTLSGLSRQSAPVVITIIPGLSSVSVSPSSASLPLNASRPFQANVSCTGGPCPAGIRYAWSLSNGLGALNTTTGPAVNFTAGPLPGTLTLALNATLDNVTVAGAPVSLTLVPALASVTVAPAPATVFPGAALQLSATLWCTGGTCPSGAVYSWSLNNTLGTLNYNSTPTVIFQAGSLTGLTKVSLSVRLEGLVQHSLPTIITITREVPGLQISSLDITPFPARVGQDLSISVGVVGGTPAYSYAYHGLPPGCLSSNVNPLTCRPVSPGNFSMEVVVTDSAGKSAEAPAILPVLGPIRPLTVNLTSNILFVTTGASFNLTATVAGGVGPFIYAWSVNGTNSTAAPDDPIWSLGLPHAGAYLYEVWVTDSRGLVVNSTSVLVTVQSPQPASGPTSTPLYWWLVVVALALGLVFVALGRRYRERTQAAAPGEGTEGPAGPAPPDATATLAGPMAGEVPPPQEAGIPMGPPVLEEVQGPPAGAPSVLPCGICGSPMGEDGTCPTCGQVPPASVQEPPPVEAPPPRLEAEPPPSAETLRRWLEPAPSPAVSPTPSPPGAPLLGPHECPTCHFLLGPQLICGVCGVHWEAKTVLVAATPAPAAGAREFCFVCGTKLEGTRCSQCKVDWAESPK